MTAATSNSKILIGLLLGLIVPGLGHAWYRRFDKAAFYAVALIGTYVLGLWLGEWRAVSTERFPLYFLAHMWNPGLVLATLGLTGELRITHDIAYLDAGLLFTAIAGLLNVVVLVDLYETHLRIRGVVVDKAPAQKPAGAKS